MIVLSTGFPVILIHQGLDVAKILEALAWCLAL